MVKHRGSFFSLKCSSTIYPIYPGDDKERRSLGGPQGKKQLQGKTPWPA